MFILNLLNELIRSATGTISDETKKKLDIIFGTIFNSEVSQIPERLCQLITSTSGSMLDSTRRLIVLINSLMECLFGKISQERDYSFTTQAEMKGLRLFQIYLSDMMQGGTVFDPSFLVPCSQQALTFIDMIFDKQKVLILLEKSMDKTLTHSLETTAVAIGSTNADADQGYSQFESDCINQVLVALLWFSRYSPQTSRVAEKLLS